MTPELEELLQLARARWNAMSDFERATMIASQRRGYVIAEAGFGSDADEAAYAAAVERNDLIEIDRLDREAKSRMDRARAIVGGSRDAD